MIYKIFKKHIKKSKKPKTKDNINIHKYNIKYNQSLLIHGVKKILHLLIKGNLNINFLKLVCFNSIAKTNTIDGASNPRISNIPFSKWYVKGYVNNKNLIIILRCKINKTPNLLDKNLKLIYNQITIISITNKSNE